MIMCMQDKLTPDFDSGESIIEYLVSDSQPKSDEWRSIVEGLKRVEFHDENVCLAPLIGDFFRSCPRRLLNELSVEITDFDSHLQIVMGECILNDYSLDGLEPFLQYCKTSTMTRLVAFASRFEQHRESGVGKLKTICDRFASRVGADAYLTYISDDSFDGYRLMVEKGMRFPALARYRIPFGPGNESTNISISEFAMGHFLDGTISNWNCLSRTDFRYNPLTVNERVEDHSVQKFELNDINNHDLLVILLFRESLTVSKNTLVYEANIVQDKIQENNECIAVHALPTKFEREKRRTIGKITELVDDSDSRYFEKILCECIRTLEFDLNNSSATLSLYQQSNKQLNVVASVGDDSASSRESQILSVSKGEGISSWAALNRSPILIENLSLSVFRDKFVHVMKNTQSAIAIPIESHGRLLAVCNIESKTPYAFCKSELKILNKFCNKLAQAIDCKNNSSQRVRKIEQKFAEFSSSYDASCSRAYNSDDNWVLSCLASIGKDCLGADEVEIWGVSRIRNDEFVFHVSASSDKHFDGFDLNPRPHGWSTEILRCGQPLFIRVSSDGCAGKAFENGDWFEYSVSYPANPKLMKYNKYARVAGRPEILCEVGIPVSSQGNAIGVVWLKYFWHHPLPTPSDVFEANFFGHMCAPWISQQVSRFIHSTHTSRESTVYETRK